MLPKPEVRHKALKENKGFNRHQVCLGGINRSVKWFCGHSAIMKMEGNIDEFPSYAMPGSAICKTQLCHYACLCFLRETVEGSTTKQ